MASVRYEVAIHEIETKPWSRPKHHWTTLTRRPLGLDRAQELASLQDTHATVQIWRSSDVVFDNGKPARPWTPAVAAPASTDRTRARSAAVVDRAPLPRVVRFLDTTESSTCPHCGASGKYVNRLQLEDGRIIGAMAGCTKLFPIAPIAQEEFRLRKKATDYETKGWVLNSWDTRALDALESYFAGMIDERTALATVRTMKQAATAWRKGRQTRRD